MTIENTTASSHGPKSARLPKCTHARSCDDQKKLYPSKKYPQYTITEDDNAEARHISKCSKVFKNQYKKSSSSPYK